MEVLAPMVGGQSEGRRGADAIAMALALLPLTLVFACNTKECVKMTAAVHSTQLLC